MLLRDLGGQGSVRGEQHCGAGSASDQIQLGERIRESNHREPDRPNTLDSVNKNNYRFGVSREIKRLSTTGRSPLTTATPTPEVAARRINSSELLGPRGEIIIQHDGREYRLRLTQNGKLILTA
jgi:hemin uptake protein HemP